MLKIIQGLIDDCGPGLSAKKGKGTPIGVSIEAISIASSREIFGGLLIHAPKMKNPFSRVPTGYNVCLKLIFPDGFISRLYTGFGYDNLCGTGTLKFEGVSPPVCDALMPKGHVGWVVPRASYAFTSLPYATTEELLDQIRLQVMEKQPVVGVLAFPVTLSRDASIKACEVF